MTTVSWSAPQDPAVLREGETLSLTVTFVQPTAVPQDAALVLVIGVETRLAVVPANPAPETEVVASYTVEPGLFEETGVAVLQDLRLADDPETVLVQTPALDPNPDVRVSSAEGIRHVVLRDQLVAGTPVLSVDRLRGNVVVGARGESHAARTEPLQVYGDVFASGDVLAVSDARVKEDVREIPDALARLRDVRGVTFRRKDGDPGARHTGLLAQELERALPEAVFTDRAGMKSIAYGNVVGILVQAVRELGARLEALEAKG